MGRRSVPLSVFLKVDPATSVLVVIVEPKSAEGR